MINVIFPNKLRYILDLIRFRKPIGFMLLAWPCWFALTKVSSTNNSLIKWYIFFFLGAFLMRSGGCIINDIVDKRIDSNVERTSERPLASNKITILEAIVILTFIFFLSLIILLQFNYKVIFLGFFSIPLIIIYPFLKRFTYWPQIGLGLIFSWGILMVAIQFLEKISYEYFLLYIACIFWTIGYDTIYAYQDIEDDKRNNIKSTAVLFGNKGKIFVKIFYSIFLFLLGIANFLFSQSFLSLIVIILLIIAINIYLNKWDIDSKISCNYFFNFNNIIGLLCFIFLISF